MQLPLNRFERGDPVVDAVKLQWRLLRKVGAERHALRRSIPGLLPKLLGDVLDGGIKPPNLEVAELDLRGELDQQHASHHQVYRAKQRISKDIGRRGPGDPGKRHQVQCRAVWSDSSLGTENGLPAANDTVSAKAKGTFNFPERAPFRHSHAQITIQKSAIAGTTQVPMKSAAFAGSE